MPELAARAHLENLPTVFETALDEAGIGVADIELVCATAGPGLIGALLVGLSAGKALAFARGLPAIGVNHLEGHLYSAHLRPGGEPALALDAPFHGLVVSGGHAELVRVESDRIVALARTRDDAPGEAFDKVARRAGLPYPGGPVVDRIAAKADGSRFTLPIGRVSDGSDDFSFSGLKTAMLREFEKRGVDGTPIDADDAFRRPRRSLRVLPARDRHRPPRAGPRRPRAGRDPLPRPLRRSRRQLGAARHDLEVGRGKRRRGASSGAIPDHRQRRDDRLGGFDPLSPRGSDSARRDRGEIALAFGNLTGHDRAGGASPSPTTRVPETGRAYGRAQQIGVAPKCEGGRVATHEAPPPARRAG